MVRFFETFVPGIPVQQGSKTAGVTKDGRAYVRDANAPKLRAWRQTLLEHLGGRGIHMDGMLRVSMTFYMPRPQRPEYERPAVKPDLDKLVRAVNDGLTASGIIADDARIVSMRLDEYYAESVMSPRGVYVSVEQV